ncbi:MAG: hypothetical protein ACAH88_07680, partial [Roseimicrobium sp.]
RRALLFSNYAAEHTFLPVVREACQQEGIDLEVIGSGVLHQVPDPERVLKDYDLVFAKARCAMESLATGCATVLCGTEGVGPLVTRENFDRLRRDNFGRRCLPLPMTVENLVTGMRQYSAADSGAVTDHARAELDLEHTVDQWCALYEEILTLPCPVDAEAEAMAAAAMLRKLGAPLFRTFELESVKDYLQHEAKGLGERLALLQNEQTVTQEKMQQALAEAGSQHESSAHLRAKLKQTQEEKKRYRDERDVAREKAHTGLVVKGALAWMWRHRVLRPIAKLMGVRALPGKSRHDKQSGSEP